MLEPIRYCHLRDGRAVVSIGYQLDRENNRVQYAVSYCSRKDQFSKKVAHEKLQERLSSVHHLVEMTPATNISKKFRRGELILNIIDHINSYPVSKKPSWAYRIWVDFMGGLRFTNSHGE